MFSAQRYVQTGRMKGGLLAVVRSGKARAEGNLKNITIDTVKMQGFVATLISSHDYVRLSESGSFLNELRF